MTEEEAKQKACCAGAHRPMDSGACIGSDCMAWRWESRRVKHQTVDETGEQIGQPWFEGHDDGYCGLAGKP